MGHGGICIEETLQTCNIIDSQERREIERALLQGELWGVAATNAMELGVDIGSLDVTLHLGFPGSIASLWQQARPYLMVSFVYLQ